MSRKQATDAALKQLRAFGLGYPGAYLSVEGDPFSISCKLPHSYAVALMLPFTEPTAYGLGKSGWVSAKFPDGKLPLDMLKAWIDESYRAQAPKKLVASLAGSPAAKPKARKSGTKRPTSRAAPKRAKSRR